MVDKFILVECFLNDEYYEYTCDNDEFLTYRIKNIVGDWDVFVHYHCCSEMKNDRLDNGIMYDSETLSDMVRVSYNGDLDKDIKKEIAKTIRESLVYVDYPFVENEDGDNEKNYDEESPSCYLSVKYVVFNKCDDVYNFDSNQEVVVQRMEDWE